MKSKALKPFSGAWASAWDDLLSTRVAIRSFLEFGVHSNTYETELVFKDKGVGRPIYLVRFEGSLGAKKEGKVRIEEYATHPFSFLEDWRDYLFSRARLQQLFVVHRILEPLHHVAIVNLCFATEGLFLPPTHPLMLLNYGMVYERIAAERWTYRSDDFNAGNVLAVLALRFGAFLYQQQLASVQATLGEVAVAS